MTPVLLVSAALYLSLLIIIVLEIKTCKWRAEPLALLILALHGIIYFSIISVDYINGKLENPILWNVWSSTLRFHSILTIAGIEFFRLLRIKGGIKSNGCK